MLITLLILAALLGLPLFAVLGAAALLAADNAGLTPAVLIIELYRLASSPNLVAIPLFTLAGVVLAAGGAAQRLVTCFQALLGGVPGGMAAVALVSCALFTALSGASGVTILALGGLLLPMLQQAGYPPRFNLGMLTSGGSLGLLFPPSLAVLLYAVIAGVAIDQLFLATLLPGLLLLLILALYGAWIGHRAGVGGPARAPIALGPALRRAGWDLLLPPLILGGLFGGWIAVSEVAALTAAYALLLEFGIHRSLRLRHDLLPLAAEAALLVGSILIILGVAMGLTNLIIDARLPMQLLDWLGERIDSPLEFLLWLNLFLLAVGALLDIFSAIVVVVPLLLPLAAHFGIHPLHLGVIFLANLEIGYLTPPVGLNLFIASQRFGRPILQLFRATLPFLGLLLLWLALLTYVPALSLWWQPDPPGHG